MKEFFTLKYHLNSLYNFYGSKQYKLQIKIFILLIIIMGIVILFSSKESSGNPTCWGVLRSRLMNDSTIINEAGSFVRISSPLPQSQQEINLIDTVLVQFDVYAYYSSYPVVVTASFYKVKDSCFLKEYNYKKHKVE